MIETMARARLGAALVALALAGCAAVGPSDIGEEQYGGTVCPAGTMINGMDIAACQAANWPAVKAGGIQFAIIKATEGNGSSWYYVNSRFAGDWAGSKAAGVIRGAYHYFHPELDGKAQADFMMSILNKDGGLLPGDMPPMLDWEEPQCCGSPLPAGCGSASPSCGTPVSTMQANGMAFVNEIKALTGRDTLIYTYPWVWTYVIGAPGWAANYPLDISSFNSCPYVPGPWSNWKVWQYNTCASVAGVSGICGSGCIDVDHFNGDLAAMQAWTNAAPPEPVHSFGPIDFNGDGLADVLFRCSGCSWFTLPAWISTGAGTFSYVNKGDPAGGSASTTIWDSGAKGIQTLAGDFDGDGRTDVMLRCGGCGWFTMPTWLSTGAGTFSYVNDADPAGGTAASTIWDSGAAGIEPIVGDFNGDGMADVALRCAGCGWNTTPTWISMGGGKFAYVNNPDPSGGTAATSLWNSAATGVEVLRGDFNGDGRTDVALRCAGCGWSSIPTFLSTGAGTFTYVNNPDPAGGSAATTIWSSGAKGIQTLVGDFNGDGKADVALRCAGCGWFTTPTFLSTGAGTFTYVNNADPAGGTAASSVWNSGSTGVQAITGDFNGDGRTDVVLRCDGCSWNTTPTFLSTGAGTFTYVNAPDPAKTIWNSGAAGVEAVPGDFNGDGRTDVALRCSGCGWFTTPTWIANGDGTYQYVNNTDPSGGTAAASIWNSSAQEVSIVAP